MLTKQISNFLLSTLTLIDDETSEKAGETSLNEDNALEEDRLLDEGGSSDKEGQANGEKDKEGTEQDSSAVSWSKARKIVKNELSQRRQKLLTKSEWVCAYDVDTENLSWCQVTLALPVSNFFFFLLNLRNEP